MSCLRITQRLPLGKVIAIGPLAGLTAAAVMLSTVWSYFPQVAERIWIEFLCGGGDQLSYGLRGASATKSHSA